MLLFIVSDFVSFCDSYTHLLTIERVMDRLKQILALPVNALIVVLLFPVFVVCRLMNVLSMLAEIPNIITSGEVMTTIEFIRSDKMAEHRRQSILGSEFPNSIAVRS